MKIRFILFIFIIIPIMTQAQDRYDYSTDTMSYRLYLNSDWEYLYQEVKQAQKQDISFYFLELRGAFAAFHTQRYREAVRFFLMAEQRKTGDYVVREYHYLSALYANMELETFRSFELMEDSTQQKYTSPATKILEMVSLTSGYNANTDFESLGNEPFDGNFGIYGERMRLKNLNFQELYLAHHFLPSIRVTQSLQLLNLYKELDFYYIDYTTLAESNNNFDIQTSQWQYFINTTINLNDKLFIQAAFTHMHYNSEYIDAEYNSTSYEYSFLHKNIKGKQSLFALSTYYKYKRLSVSAISNYMVTDRFNRYQGGMESNYFLNKNKNQYLGAAWYIHNISSHDKNKNWQNVWAVRAGFKINNAWLELNHSQGSHKNLAINNGQIVFNSLEDIQMRTGANLSIPLYHEQLWLNLYYRYIKYTSKYTYSDSSSNFYNDEFYHFNHSISGGLSWYF